MVLVLFFLSIMAFIIVITLMSTLKITIIKLDVSNEIPETPIVKDFSASIGIYLFNRFKIYKKNITKDSIQQMKKSKNMKKIKKQFINENKIGKSIKEDKNIIKQLNPKLEKINLKILLGTEDVILTSFLICIISIAFSILLSQVIKKYDKRKYQYEILPIYDNKNSIKILLEGILSIKLVNIISIVFRLVFRSDVKDERTSNRRSYDNCNEQY